MSAAMVGVGTGVAGLRRGAALEPRSQAGRPPCGSTCLAPGLILLSMTQAFNLSAFLMEASWAALSLFGLVRLWLRRS